MTTRLSSSVLLFTFLSCFLLACHSKKEKSNDETPLVLNEETVTAFGRQIERSIYNEDANFLNNAFDTTYIKEKISENSIVSSSLEAKFGVEYFNQILHIGNFILQTVQNGGHYKLVSCYFKENKHHLIFRLYADFGILIEDYEIDIVDNQYKIKDGFNYNLGISLTDKIKFSMLYSILEKTDSEGTVSLFFKIEELIEKKEIKKALDLLKNNESLLCEYPQYSQLLIKANYLYKHSQFIPFLENLHLDQRMELIHKFLFYTNLGYLNESQEVINQLIEITGDDPIYLYFFGRANFIAKKYNDALICFEEVEKGLPFFWDLWFSKLETLYKLNESEAFITTLRKSEELYGMSQEEMITLTKKSFPRMLPKVETNFK